MNKEIKYHSITSAADPRSCPDGDLDISLNLINEDGALRPIAPPSPILHIPDNQTLLYIHQPPSIDYSFYILSDQSTLYFAKSSQDNFLSTIFSYTLPCNSSILKVSSIGNTIIAATSSGILYFLFRETNYIPLGSKPPMPVISFGVQHHFNLGKELKYSEILNNFLPTGSHKADYDEATEIKRLTDAVYGHLLYEVATDVTSKGYFYQPFFVRYAVRLFDGSYILHSAPILMLCTTHAPKISFVIAGSGSDNYHQNVASYLQVPYYKLLKKIIAVDESLANWVDIIKGVDIFASEPIYTYEQSKNLPTNAWLTEIAWYKAQLPYKVDDDGHYNYFIGHYKDIDGVSFYDHIKNSTTMDSGTYIWNIRPHENFATNLKHTSNFYKIAEIDFDKLTPDADFAELTLTQKDLTNLTSRQALPDDYQSHCEFTPRNIFAYNNRLHLCDASYRLANPLHISASVAAGISSSNQQLTITVWTKTNGQRHQISCTFANDPYLISTSCEFPRYLYYPDSSAYAMRIVSSNGATWQFALTQHPFLNGAFYAPDDILAVNPYPNQISKDDNFSPVIDVRNKIYTSEVDNPFLFEAKSIVSVGVDRVIALSTATKALSQGQFGQHPLYAFTNEGIWALEVSTSGTYISRQPISRDILLNNDPASITQIDNAVLFAAPRGIMLLSGASSQCISSELDRIQPLHSSITKTLSALPSYLTPLTPALVPLPQYLKGAVIAFDYPNQHIIISNPAHNYSYIYSLRSKLWGMSSTILQYTVNSYPYALAVAPHNCLLEFRPNSLESSAVTSRLAAGSAEAELPSTLSTLILSRPIKLDNPDTLKSLNTLIQRHSSTDATLCTIILATRNYINYIPIASSARNRLTNLRGSGYKAFRIIAFANLSTTDYISSASISLTPKQTNKLH